MALAEAAVVRKNARCLCCGAERPPVAVRHGDAFCSTACARAYNRVRDVWLTGIKDREHQGEQSTKAS
jgi:hypothetical protein